MSKIALVSGYGMDAKTITHILLSMGYTVILGHRRNITLNIKSVLTLFDSDLKKYPESKLDTIIMDISDQSSVEQAILKILDKYGSINELYHLAAMSHVHESFKMPMLSVITNGHSTFFILEALRKYSPQTKFYFANTSECFGGDPENCPFNEKSPQELRSPYAWSKNLGANITKFYRQTYGMYACFGWLFNHSNIYRHDSFYFMKVIKAATRITLGKQKELQLGNLNFWRDEHLSDFGCEMMIKMLNNPKGPYDYVIGNGQANHGEEYLEYAFGFYNLKWQNYVKFDASLVRPNEVIKLVADPRKAIEELGWKPNRICLKDHIYHISRYVYEQEQGNRPERPDFLSMYPG